MAVSLVTGRGYASHHVDALLSATIHSTFALMTVPRPIVGPQKLITMLGMPVGMGIGGVAHGWGFPLTTRTVLVRNTGTLGGGPHNTTFTAKGYDCVNRKGRFGGGVITANGCGTALTGMNNRNISLVAGQIGVGSFAGGAFNVPTIAMVNSFLPEPGRTLQMLAGVVGLLGIAAWRSRRSR
jgi:hypothetical protein